MELNYMWKKMKNKLRIGVDIDDVVFEFVKKIKNIKFIHIGLKETRITTSRTLENSIEGKKYYIG